MDSELRELVEFMNFSENVTAKLHRVQDETEIYTTVAAEFAESARYDVSVLLLTHDGTGLTVAATSLPQGAIGAAEKATGLCLQDYRLDLDNSSTWSQVVRGKETLAARSCDILEEWLPHKPVDVISQITGYQGTSSVLTPLWRDGRIIGAISVDGATPDARAFPAVQRLAEHISIALEASTRRAALKREEEALRASEQRFRQMAAALPVVFWMVSPDWKHVYYISPAAEKIFGRSCQILCERPAIWLESVHPADRELVSASRSRHCMESTTCEYRFVRHDGEIRWLKDRSSAVRNELGELVMLAGFTEDVTAQQQAQLELHHSEARSLALLRAIPDLLFRLKSDGTFLDFKAASGHVLLAPPEEFLGKPVQDVVPPEDAKKVMHLIQRALQTGETQTYEYEQVVGNVRRCYEARMVASGKDEVVTVARDVTADKRTLHELRESEARYRGLFEHSPVALWEEDWSEVKAHLDELRATGIVDFAVYFESNPQAVQHCESLVKVLDVNDAAVELYQASREQLLAGVLHLLPNEAHEVAKQHLCAVSRGETWFESDLANQTLAGEQRIVVFRWFVPPSHEESLERVLVSVVDVSDRKHVEDMLRESERTVRALLDAVPQSVFLMDTEGTILAANETLAQRMNARLGTLVGSSIYDFLDPDMAAARRERAEQVIRSGEPLEFEDVRTGRSMHHSVCPLFDAQGRVARLAIVGSDITDRKQAEEQLRESQHFIAQIANAAPSMMLYLYDLADQRSVYVSGQLGEILGHTVEEIQRMGSRMFELLVHPDDLKSVTENLARVATEDTDQIMETEYRMKHANGQWRWLLNRGTVFKRNAAGLPTQLVGVATDITDRKRTEAQLLRTERMASLGMMAGGIAHQLRNPLGIVSACSQLLLDAPDDAQRRRQCVEKIGAAASRASQVIESLLRFARPEGAPMAELELGPVVEAALSSVTQELALQKIKLEQHLQPCLPKVLGNGMLLQQVFANVILNASHAMPQGGTLSVTTRAGETGSVEIQFHDTGVGIPAEALPSIFDPFFTTTPVGGGVGLGLPISSQIIQQHGGTIDIQSQVDEGTVVTIRLPLLEGGK